MMIKLLCFFLTITYASNNSLQVVTSDFAPYQTQKENKIEGITTEIVQKVISKAGFTGEFNMYPWPRAYKIAQHEPNTIIYSIVRTPEREKQFKWIGAIAPYNVYFWKLKSRKDVKLKTVDEAKSYKSGCVFDDVKSAYLESVGFKRTTHLECVGNDTLNIRKLYAGRVDLLPYDDLSMPYKIENSGYDFDKIEKVIRIDGISHDLYMAASLQVSDETVKKLITALEEFKKTKKYRSIKSRIK